nr:hypothetical protein Iba_scaffold588CG0010 [Ipomoea batatas]
MSHMYALFFLIPFIAISFIDFIRLSEPLFFDTCGGCTTIVSRAGIPQYVSIVARFPRFASPLSLSPDIEVSTPSSVWAICCTFSTLPFANPKHL